VGFEPTTPGLKVTCSAGQLWNPAADTNSAVLTVWTDRSFVESSAQLCGPSRAPDSTKHSCVPGTAVSRVGMSISSRDSGGTRVFHVLCSDFVLPGHRGLNARKVLRFSPSPRCKNSTLRGVPILIVWGWFASTSSIRATTLTPSANSTTPQQ
jgi:hypothetical protein